MNFFISGRVQGVWFRSSTREYAKSLGVTGWVRNLADGRVEVLACGDENQLKDLKQWLHRGPNLAKVTHVDARECEYQSFEDFNQR